MNGLHSEIPAHVLWQITAVIAWQLETSSFFVTVKQADALLPQKIYDGRPAKTHGVIKIPAKEIPWILLRVFTTPETFVTYRHY